MPIGSSVRVREAGCVPDLVDPGPVIDEKLRALASEHAPRITAMERSLAEAGPDDARRLKSELRPGPTCVRCRTPGGREAARSWRRLVAPIGSYGVSATAWGGLHR